MNKQVLENFINWCDEMTIVTEEAKKWNALDRAFYKTSRMIHTSKLSLNNQLNAQKKELKEKYESAKREGTLDAFFTLVEKRKAGIQRKINGNEIKDKHTLQKFITLYDEYLAKNPSKSNAIESLLEFCDNMTIAEEAKLTAAQRKALPDSAFGLPELRKYPLIVKDENGENEWNHLRDAIAFFHMCKDEKQRKELATNIAKVIKEYNLDIQISEKNAIRKYAKFN